VVADHAPSRSSVADIADDHGSQALEFAMVLPLFGLLLALFVHTGLLLGDVVMAQGIAREVARSAAVEGDAAARDVGRALVGRRDVRIEIAPRDGLVEARVELRSPVFASTGVDVWVPARVAMRPEGPLSEAVDG
jgi:Flp pilus assembly protein TadG